MKQWLSTLLAVAFLLMMGLRVLESPHPDWRVPVLSEHMSLRTWLFVISSLLTFAVCVSNAVHLLGARAALTFVGIAAGIGWFVEETGVKYGWWFGPYTYSSMLGWKLGEVPVIVPLMWFAVVYVAYMICNLIMWRAPVQPRVIQHLIQGRFAPLVDALALSLAPAAVVLAYDLGVDPYMTHMGAYTASREVWTITSNGLSGLGVNLAKASPQSIYLGVSIQAFRGWFFVAFCMVFAFRMAVRTMPVVPISAHRKREALVPVLLYWGWSSFQYNFGHPSQTQMVAAAAMGIPFLFALGGWNAYRLSTDSNNEGATA
jgi:putative membrane protein